MIKKPGREWLLIIYLIIAVVIMEFPVIYTNFYHDITGEPIAKDGSINMSSANPADGKIYLDGEWEFYWNRFIVSEPEPLSSPDLFAAVPGEWSNYEIDGSRLPAAGFGSYKLIIHDLSASDSVTISVPDFGSAYRVFIDGQLAAESGVVSKDMDLVFTVPESKLYPVTLSPGTTHEIVLEIATTRFSGLYMSPVLSDYNHMISENNTRNAIRYCLFGVVIFSFLNLLFMYTVSIRSKLHSSWMPVLMFLLIIRIMLTSEFFSIWQPILFFNRSYEATNEFMYLITFVLKYFLIFLVQEQCGIQFSKKEKLGFAVYYALLYLIYLIAPQGFTNQYLSVIIPMLTYILDIYLFVRIYLGRKSLPQWGMLIYWGAILVVTGLTIDSYYINGMINTNMSLTLLLFFTLFSIIMSWVYSMRVSDLYDDFSQSSSKLELAQNQLAMQKEYYDALSMQMSEIREIKHDFRHFTGAMSRLAEENKMDELKIFLTGYSEKTKMEELPVFCENIVANSIIGFYFLRAKKYGIPFESRCKIESKIAMSDSDVCIVLGNALENAIDACRLLEHPEKAYVFLEAGTIKGQRLFKVRNSYNGRLEIKGGRYLSSKGGKSHSLGIPNIKRVIEFYGGFVKIEQNVKEFTLMAAVPLTVHERDAEAPLY